MIDCVFLEKGGGKGREEKVDLTGGKSYINHPGFKRPILERGGGGGPLSTVAQEIGTVIRAMDKKACYPQHC